MRRAGSTFGRRLIIENNKNGAQRPAQGAPRGAQGSGGPRRNKKKKMTAGRVLGAIMRFIASCLCVCIILGSVAAVAVSLYVVKETQGDSDLLDLTQLELAYTTIIYSQQINDQGQPEWVEYQRLQSPEENRIWKPLNEISPYIQHAFVAVEDENFYTHPGFSFKRTVLAAINEVFRKLTGSYLTGSQLGASTIEQQLIKNITGEDESSGIEGYARKVKEIFRAIALDNRFSKEEILEAYLNTIGLTGNTAGVEAGANQYFGKSAADVTIAEAASIAAITKNPSRFNPYTNPEEHLKRRDDIILFMQQQGYITQAEAEAAWATPLNLVEKTTDENAAVQTDYSWFTDQVISEVIDDLVAENPLGRENWDRKAASDYLYNGGLRIYTTVDPDLQAVMENALERGYSSFFPTSGLGVATQATKYNEDGTIARDENGDPIREDVVETPQAAMVSVGYDGSLKAIVGGIGEKEVSRGLNRGTVPRQVGSTMKPIGAYALALEKNKINWSTPLLDAPVRQLGDEKTGELKDWPANFSKTYAEDDILVVDALAQSINTIAVRVGEQAGVGNIYRFMKNSLGVTSLTPEDNDSGPMILGSQTHGISPYELAGAYMMLGNGGSFTTLHCYTSVQTGYGREIAAPELKTKQVLGTDTAYVMNRLLAQVMQGSGTAAGYRVRGEMDSVGKTGTSSDNRDYWFVGMTPYYVTATWYGYDSGFALNTASGTHAPTTAWKYVMERAQQGLPVLEFPVDESVVTAEYCTESGGLAAPGCPRTATGYYTQGNLPAVCRDHAA